MRILFVLENYWPHIGGVEVVFGQLGEQLALRGHSVTVLTRRHPGTKKTETHNGVRIERISTLGSRNLFTLFAIPSALRLAKEADIVHTTTFNGAPPAWLAARIRRKPVLITVHEVWLRFWNELTDVSWLSRKMHQLLEWKIYRLPFDAYAAVSEFTAKDLASIGIPKRKIHVVYNAVDYTTFSGRAKRRSLARKKEGFGDFTYFAYGRPGVSKGFSYLIDAAVLVRDALPQSKLVLVLSRDKDYRKGYDEIVRRIHRLGLEGHIELREPLPRARLPDMLAAADCVVVPSLREGFGYAAAEPCAMGTPVVSTNAASLPEVVCGTHVLVPPKDAKALAEGIISVARKKAKKTPLKKFTLEKNVSGYLSLYRSLQADERSGRA